MAAGRGGDMAGIIGALISGGDGGGALMAVAGAVKGLWEK